MAKAILMVATLAATLALRLDAQVSFYARAGATGSSVLVHDVIRGDVDTRPAVAPTIFLGASTRIAPKYGLGLEASFTKGALHTDYGTTRTDLGTLRSGALLGLLDGAIAGPLRWRAGFGAIHYFASDRAGILAGGGTTRLLAGGGLDLRQPVFSRWDLMVSGRYDFNRFSSPALRNLGFTQTQGVQRVSLSLGLARSQ